MSSLSADVLGDIVSTAIIAWAIFALCYWISDFGLGRWLEMAGF